MGNRRRRHHRTGWWRSVDCGFVYGHTNGCERRRLIDKRDLGRLVNYPAPANVFDLDQERRHPKGWQVVVSRRLQPAELGAHIGQHRWLVDDKRRQLMTYRIPADARKARRTDDGRRQVHARYAAEHGLASADWPALGTTAHLVVTQPSGLRLAREVVETTLAEVDLAASRFRPDAELVRLNASPGEWVSVSPLLARALRVAVDAAEWTDGLVDPTVGADLVDLGYDQTFSLVALEGPPLTVRVRSVSDWRGIELDGSGRARIPAGAVVDLGATAKGLAADLCAAAAATVAECGVLVSLGGDISVDGPTPPGGWPVNVSDHSDLALSHDEAGSQTVVLRDGGLATSSIRARRWRRGGSVLHHILDPRSGFPADGPWRTVSVSAATCTLANAASTAAVILGRAAPTWLATRELPARLVTVDGSVTCVGGWPEQTGNGSS